MLGKGSFGEVFQATDLNTGDSVAVKFECRLNNPPRQLLYESKLYELFRDIQQIPKCYGHGKVVKEGVPHHYLVLQRVGKSFQELPRIDETEACALGILALEALEQLWKVGVCHRDIKPANICFGTGDDASKVYLLDFGLAKKFRRSDGSHIPIRRDKHMTGTPRYASLRVSNGFEQAPRDDFEGLLYVLVYMIKGRLPWQGIDASNKETKHKRIAQKKATTPLGELLSGMDEKWVSLLEYARNVPYEDVPTLGRRHFRRILMRLKRKKENTTDV